MRNQKRNAVGLLALGLILCVVQAGIWLGSTASARSETDKQNAEQRHAPNEMAGVAGIFLLIAAGVLASIPRHSVQHRSRS